MKNMKQLHEYLGLSCSLLDFTKFLRKCLPVPLDSNFATKTWPDYDKIKNANTPKAPKPQSKKQKKIEEDIQGKQAFEEFYASLGRPLPIHWVKWFCCKASSIYWTLGIQSEWKGSTNLDDASKQLLDIAKTYRVEHRHRISEQPSSQFSFEVNHKRCSFFFDQIEDVSEITGTLYVIQPNNTRDKIVEVGLDDLHLSDSFSALYKEWNIKCNLNQFGIFLVLCLPYRLFDYEPPTQGGVRYSSSRFVSPWFEDDPEDIKMFKSIHKYIQEEEEDDDN